MRCFSTVSTVPVCLAALVAISLLSVGQSTSAEETAKETSDEAATESTVETPRPLRLWADDLDPERTEQIFDILGSDLTGHGLDFQGATLEEVIVFLREEYSLQIQLDSVGLDDLGIGPDEPVTINIQNVKMGVALEIMLKPLEMDYAVQNGILILTSEEEALTKLSVAFYPIEDLLNEEPDFDSLIDVILATVASGSWAENDGGKGTLDYDSLLDVIVATIAPGSWAENGGGDAEIRPFPPRSVLVVSQTMRVHRQIAAFLAALRECRANPHANPYSTPTYATGGGGGGGGQF